MSASTGTPSVSDGPPPKKLRKGTHSCIECESHTHTLPSALAMGISIRVTDRTIGRRRKKSCVPRSATPECCEECFARGVQCRNQEVSLSTKRRTRDEKHDLEQRVAELETALLSVTDKLDTTPNSIKHARDTAKTLQHVSEVVPPSQSHGLDSEVLLEHAPVLSLFDNAIISRRPDDGARANLHGNKPQQSKANNNPKPKFDNIRTCLLSLFPSQQRQDAILNTSQTWWANWQDAFPQIFGPGSCSDVLQFITELKASGSVQKVAKAFLCLIMMQGESATLDASWDTETSAHQTSQALNIIDDAVFKDDELAGTIDGVECMVLRAKYEGNHGRIRKSWLLFRHAISFAQLLGLHKRMASPEGNKNQSLRRETLWIFLYSSDRFLSLLLGLPYGPSEIHSDIGRDSELSTNGIHGQNSFQQYNFRLANIVGHTIDRNQQLPSNNMLPLTFKIEAEMMELADSMPSDWWESGLENGGTSYQMFNRLLPQFWHHQARTLLHLPFMLKATTDRRFEYNKIATLESSREMIKIYRVIRPVKGFGSLVCKMMDFQVFTAAMILILNLLDLYGRNGSRDYSEAEDDQTLILSTTGILQRASSETDGGVATQAARALENFGNIKEMTSLGGKSGYDCTAKMVIPFFGTVVFGPGASFKEQANTRESSQPQQLPTPGESSLDGSTSGSAPSNIPSMAPMIPFESNHGENMQGVNMDDDIFADINFDLDQDWTWFWNNTEIPFVDLQGRTA